MNIIFFLHNDFIFPDNFLITYLEINFHFVQKTGNRREKPPINGTALNFLFF